MDHANTTAATHTERLDLRPPVRTDVDELFAICSDPRVWQHFPSRRHTTPERAHEMVERWMRGWESVGLDTWVVRRAKDSPVIGYGGCSLLHDAVWNLGYRLAPEVQGNGYATEVSREGIRCARRVKPELPIVAYLLEHNAASDRVARKLGMKLVHRGPDAGNPDPAAVRLVYADRPLTDSELAAALH